MPISVCPQSAERGAKRRGSKNYPAIVGIIGESACCRLCRRPHKRHRFAVQTLLHWHRTGEDVRRRLPVLSTYLGHAHVTDTYWYVSGTPELMESVAERLEKRWEAGR